jgi:hypothetical protein
VAPHGGNDWGDGDASYAANYKIFGGDDDHAWDAKATLAASFPDGTSNTIMWAEKYARCDGLGEGGCYWYRGIYQGTGNVGPGTGSPDSFPGDHFSCVFGGGVGLDTAWTQGAASRFLVRPLYPLNGTADTPPGQCYKTVASTSHQSMQAALADGSVRSISDRISATTWAALLTPKAAVNEMPLGPDWTQQ